MKYRSQKEIANDLEAYIKQQDAKRIIDNVGAFALQMRYPLTVYPTPIISDEELEYWGNFYLKHKIRKMNVSFILFLQIQHPPDEEMG